MVWTEYNVVEAHLEFHHDLKVCSAVLHVVACLSIASMCQ